MHQRHEYEKCQYMEYVCAVAFAIGNPSHHLVFGFAPQALEGCSTQKRQQE